MRGVFIIHLGAVALALAMGSSSGVPAAKTQASAVQGLWRSAAADTTLRVTVTRSEARGLFVEIGQGAQALGFKPGDLSFTATLNGNYLHGEQTIRYGGTCYPEGRKVPMIGRMTPDGQVLAIHFYNLTVDANCRDTGEYSVLETLWQRARER